MAGKIKGFVLLSRRTFVLEKLGAAALAQIVASLPAADQALLKGPLVVSGWYPADAGVRFDDAIIRVAGGSAAEHFKELGRRSAHDNLAAFQANFLNGRTPQKFLSMAPSLYRLYYERGSREYQETSATSGVLITRDAENVTAGDCLTVIGWYEEALGMLGARQVVVSHPVCRATGGTVCRYEVTWT